MEEPNNPDPIARAVVKARRDLFFLGSVLAEYEAATRQDQHEVASWLGCSSGGYNKLALCRRPRLVESSLRNETERIANYAGCSLPRLIQILRLTASLSSLKDPSGSETALLMAARDRKREDDAQ